MVKTVKCIKKLVPFESTKMPDMRVKNGQLVVYNIQQWIPETHFTPVEQTTIITGNQSRAGRLFPVL